MTETTDSTIPQDVPGLDADEAVFLKRFAPEPAEEKAETTEAAEEPSEEATEGSEDTTEDAADETEAADEAVVKVKHGDKELKFKVADLKRLAGQEAELTRKSQEVSEVTKRATDETEKAVALVGAMIQRADKLWSDMGYDKVDLTLAAQKLPESAYKQLRSDMQAAHEQRVFLREEGNKLLGATRDARAAEHAKALSTVDANMAKDVPGWTKDSRLEVVAYAKSQGLPDAIADGLSDPAALKVIRKAMLFDKGSKVVAEKVAPAAKTAPTKTLKAGSVSDAKPDKQREALSRLRKTGSLDDAANAFLARFGG